MTILARVAASTITGAAKALTGARSVWVGCAPVPQQRIYFANHSSHSDFVLLWASLPPILRKRTRPVAGADYWSTGVVRPFVIHQVFNGVLVDRTGSTKVTSEAPANTKPVDARDAEFKAPDSAATLSQTTAGERLEVDARVTQAHASDGADAAQTSEQTHAPQADEAERVTDAEVRAPRVDALLPLKEALDAGDSLIIFPEGTRNMAEGLLPFKSGIYHLAKAYPGVEIVPVWLGNLNRVMPKGALIPLPLLCTVSFGAALQVQEGESKDAFLARARMALLQLGGVESGDAAQADTDATETVGAKAEEGSAP